MSKTGTKKTTKTTEVESAAKIASRASLLRNIGAKWDRLDEDDLAGLKRADDLVRKLVTRYGADADEARLNVASFLNGRTF